MEVIGIFLPFQRYVPQSQNSTEHRVALRDYLMDIWMKKQEK